MIIISTSTKSKLYAPQKVNNRARCKRPATYTKVINMHCDTEIVFIFYYINKVLIVLETAIHSFD